MHLVLDTLRLSMVSILKISLMVDGWDHFSTKTYMQNLHLVEAKRLFSANVGSWGGATIYIYIYVYFMHADIFVCFCMYMYAYACICM